MVMYGFRRPSVFCAEYWLLLLARQMQAYTSSSLLGATTSNCKGRAFQGIASSVGTGSACQNAASGTMSRSARLLKPPGVESPPSAGFPSQFQAGHSAPSGPPDLRLLPRHTLDALEVAVICGRHHLTVMGMPHQLASWCWLPSQLFTGLFAGATEPSSGETTDG